MLCWCRTLAGWHKSGEVLVPEGIHLLLLPPYSPELQRGSTSLAAHKRSHRLSSLRVARIEVQEVQAERCVVLAVRSTPSSSAHAFPTFGHGPGNAKKTCTRSRAQAGLRAST